MADAIVVEGWKDIRRRLSRLPKTAQKELREASRAIALDEAARLKQAGHRDTSEQAQRVAQFVRARSDRVPAIVTTSSRRVFSGGGTVRQVFYGAEFGGGRRRTTKQFRPWRGREGHWLWPQLRQDEGRMTERWLMALAGIEREWTHGG